MESGVDSQIYPHFSRNNAFRKFREEYSYINTFYYLFLSGRDVLQNFLKEQIIKHDQNLAQDCCNREYALGVVTHVYSNSEFKGVHVPRSEAVEMSQNFSGFLSVVSKHTVVSAHRSVIDYSFDILHELRIDGRIDMDPEVEAAILERRMRPKKLSETLQFHKIPYSEDDELILQLRWLSELRNCIEHNACIATKNYSLYAKDVKVREGDKIPVGPKEVGEALALVETICSQMDELVCDQYYSTK